MRYAREQFNQFNGNPAFNPGFNGGFNPGFQQPPQNDAPDVQGEIRHWANWTNRTFTPVGANTPAPSYPITMALQISPGLNQFSQDSPTLSQYLAQLSSSQFEDPQFPATFESLRGFGEAKKDRSALFSTYTWERPRQAVSSKYTVAGDLVGPQDLKQGKLGNCYLIAAMAAIAEYPERIKRLIRIRQPVEQGINCVALNVCGYWEDVIIDDRFPFDPEKRKAAFARSNSKDIWLMLIEKAWAKVNGGYSNIEAGYTHDALSTLTGAPTKLIKFKEGGEEQLWRDLVQADQFHFTCCASTSGDITEYDDDTISNEHGLCAGHAYSLISAVEVISQGRPVRLLKLRNPWGRGEWKGDWSDNSPLWTEDLIHQLEVTDKNDGIFFISLEDAIKYFQNFAICHFRDDYVSSAKKFYTSPDHPTVMSFDIQQPGDYYFKLNQINARCFSKKENYKYTALTLIVAKREGDQFVYVGNASRARDQVWTLANCTPGSYVAYISTPWKGQCNTLTFSIYAPTPINFQVQDPNFLPPNFVDAVMIDYARRSGIPPQDFSSNGEPGITQIRYKSTYEDLGFHYFSNQSASTTLKVTVTCKTVRDVQYFSPYFAKEGGSFEVRVEPGKEKILILRQDGEDAKASIEIKSSLKRK